MEFQSQLPPRIRARKGTAGSVLLCAWIGHEPGGHGVSVRSAPGQHGSSDQPYRTAVICEALSAPSGRAALATFQPSSRSPVVELRPQAFAVGF